MLTCFSFWNQTVNASHLLGGTVSYSSIAGVNDSLNVVLRLYTECSGPVNIGNVASYRLLGYNGSSYTNISAPNSKFTLKDSSQSGLVSYNFGYTVPAPCLTCPPTGNSVYFKEYRYGLKLKNIPYPATGAYTYFAIAFELGARVGSSKNLDGSVGSYQLMAVAAEVRAINGSGNYYRFDNNTSCAYAREMGPMAMCAVGGTIPSMTNTANTAGKMLTYSIGIPAKSFLVGSGYSSANYRSGYSSTQPMGAGASISINSSGEVTFTPPVVSGSFLPGYYYFTIDVAEWVAGAVVGRTRRDIVVYIDGSGILCNNSYLSPPEFKEVANVTGGSKGTGDFAITANGGCGLCFDLITKGADIIASQISLLPATNPLSNYPASTVPTLTNLPTGTGGAQVCFNYGFFTPGTYTYPFRVTKTVCTGVIRYDTALVVITVPPGLTLTKTASVTTVSLGDTFSYTLTIQAPATGLATHTFTLQDLVPAALDPIQFYQPAGYGSWVYDPATDGYKASIVNLPAGQSLTYKIMVRALRCGTVQNCASLMSPVPNSCQLASGCAPVVTVSLPGNLITCFSGQNLSTIMFSNPTATGFLVNGDLIIDYAAVNASVGYAPIAQTNISNKKFYMNPGAKFVMASGKGVQFNYCTFMAACADTLWRGIDAQAGSVLGFYSCNIYDADAALKISPTGTNYEIQSSRFINNQNGIFFTTGTPGTYASVTNNLFTMYGNLKKRYTGAQFGPLNSYIQAQALSGIWNQGTVTVGSINSVNRFRRTHLGIMNNSGILSVTGCEFDDLANNTLVTALNSGIFRGAGIANLGSSPILTVNGNRSSTANGRVLFKNCRHGVYVRGGTAFINKTYADHVTYGIRVKGTAGNRIRMISNLLFPDSVGIFLSDTQLADTVRIQRNKINMQYFPGYAGTAYNTNVPAGIVVSESGSTRAKAMYITQDTVYVEKAMYGISLQGVTGQRTGTTLRSVVVLENRVFVNQPAVSGQSITGIALNQGRMIVVDKNRVVGARTSPVTDSTMAFSFTNTLSNVISCNYSNNTVKGYAFYGDCTSNHRFITDTLGLHTFSLWLSQSGKMGPQNHKGNRWNENSTYLGYTLNPGASGTSRFEMKTGGTAPYTMRPDQYPNQIKYKPASGPHTNYIGWFNFTTPSPGSDTTANPANCTILKREDDSTAFTELYGSVIEGTYQPTEFPAPEQWNMDAQVYEHVLNDTALRNLSGVALYCDALEGESAAQIAELRAHLSRAYGDQAEGVLSALKGGIMEHLEDMYRVDSLLSTATSYADSAWYQSKRDSLIERVTNDRELAGIIEQQLLSLRAQGVSEAMTENGMIPLNELYEANYVAANAVYLQMLQEGDELTEEEVATLMPIAWQCPVAGGPGVAIARNLLAAHEYLPNYPDLDLCVQSATPLRPAAALAAPKATEPVLSVWPNPAQDMVSVQYRGQADAVQLVTLMGQVLRTEAIAGEAETLHLPTGNIPAGTYLVRLMNQGATVATSLLVIAH